ncbi:alpha-mannosidase [Agreia bicolorata]|uniref:Alpha-mannosidase n=1 Tax=Agreia bicolorata TaxID=110935 RepID=A0A1T4XMK6_9MICO|nr:glycoside hydrolase family 38 C-terminal domain-containing protein [Agreia bicolorata]SKA90780.1 alpha-mannosidase [Agreia bicolorata]
MHDSRLLTEARLDRFITERLKPALYRDTVALTAEVWSAPGEPVTFAEATAQQYSPFSIGTAWGRPWSTSWFRVRGVVPQAWRELAEGADAAVRIELVFDLGFDGGQSGFQSEGLVWGLDGVPIKAISPFNAAVVVPMDAHGRVDVFVEAAANPDVGSDWSFTPTTIGDPATAGDQPTYVMRQMDIALFDVNVYELVSDMEVLRGLMRELAPTSPRRAQILAALERALDVLDPHAVSATAAAGRAELAEVLARPASASAHVLHAVGHAHIDSAWLWPVRETIRKCARTFSNVIVLMDANPDFTFACSSAQQLSWMKEYYPALFEKIREKVRGGQFIPVGGMWVESDTNLPGSEAMARQFIAGKRFFIEEFGVDNEEVWLPDSFGYSGALPQIVAAAGSKWFLTQKISWNETNVMPHHTFQWEGIDGTRVFTHFPPVDKYNSDLCAPDIHHAERNFRDHGRATMSLLPYGYGDGGGGPTREMVSIVERTTSLEGSPRVMHSSPRAFFTAAQQEYPDADVWSGEMYLELHRGTYTSQLATKQGNRRSEHLLREAELWAATAAVQGAHAYPYDRLEKLWHLVLLQQFHDILPGSSIAWVHQDAERNYAYIAGELEELIATSLRQLAGDGERTLIFNAAPHERNGVLALSASENSERPEADGSTASRDETGFILQNDALFVRIDERGLVVELIDLASGRDAIPPGEVGNLFQLHRDTPTQWDAWDIDRHYRHVYTDLTAVDSIALGDDGCSVVVERSFGQSHLVQTISLSSGSGQLDLTIELDWHETQKLLKLAFPLDVHADRFSSEIQFGHIERATHTNTSWDVARYETSAHRWIHAGEPEFGVAIVNDSTYGYDVTRQERSGGGAFTLARLSIVRAAVFPDPNQDQGRHTLRVGVVVGADIQDAVEAGYRINLDERHVSGAAVNAVDPLFSIDNSGIVIETVKLAEDRSGDVVVRLYESLGRRSTATLDAAFGFDEVVATDLLERATASGAGPALSVSGASVSLSLRPFQLVTLRFAVGRS